MANPEFVATSLMDQLDQCGSHSEDVKSFIIRQCACTGTLEQSLHVSATPDVSNVGYQSKQERDLRKARESMRHHQRSLSTSSSRRLGWGVCASSPIAQSRHDSDAGASRLSVWMPLSRSPSPIGRAADGESFLFIAVRACSSSSSSASRSEIELADARSSEFCRLKLPRCILRTTSPLQMGHVRRRVVSQGVLCS